MSEKSETAFDAYNFLELVVIPRDLAVTAIRLLQSSGYDQTAADIRTIMAANHVDITVQPTVELLPNNQESGK